MHSIKKLIKRIIDFVLFLLKDSENNQVKVLTLLGKLHSDRVKGLEKIGDLKECEFRVFSQWGEDGIIQYLINNIEIPNRIFVEFGVEDYKEANTRFLLLNDNWAGVIVDGSRRNIRRVRRDRIFWRHDLRAVARFITRDNVNEVIRGNITEEDIGLLSIDLDGNDYWVWKEINVIRPRIVICEYNSIFGDTISVTIPYDEKFNRTKAHYSNLYWGASLQALCSLAKEKGYDYIGSNSAGNNAFFIRDDISRKFKIYCTKEGYRKAMWRESRDSRGNLSYISYENRIKEILEMRVYDLRENKVVSIRDALNAVGGSV